MKRSAGEVGKDKDEIELLEAVLDALKVANLNLAEGDDGERHIGEMDEAVGRRLEEDVGPVGNTGEAELAEGDVDLDARVARIGGRSDTLGESLELLVEALATLALLLLELDLILVAIAVLALLVARLIELDI